MKTSERPQRRLGDAQLLVPQYVAVDGEHTTIRGAPLN